MQREIKENSPHTPQQSKLETHPKTALQNGQYHFLKKDIQIFQSHNGLMADILTEAPKQSI